MVETARVFLADVTAPVPAFRRLLEDEPVAAMRILTSSTGRVHTGVLDVFARMLEDEVSDAGLELAMPAQQLAFAVLRLAQSFIYAEVIARDPIDVDLVVGLIEGYSRPTSARLTEGNYDRLRADHRRTGRARGLGHAEPSRADERLDLDHVGRDGEGLRRARRRRLVSGPVPKTTLGNERGGSAATQHLRFEISLRKLIDEVRRRGKATDPVLCQRLAAAHIKVQLIRFGGLRTLAALIDSRDPGPTASIAKMLWSEHHQRFAELGVDVLGADALVTEGGDGYRPNRWQADLFGSRSSTIWGRTDEIQRNIVGERVRGVPREPCLD